MNPALPRPAAPQYCGAGWGRLDELSNFKNLVDSQLLFHHLIR